MLLPLVSFCQRDSGYHKQDRLVIGVQANTVPSVFMGPPYYYATNYTAEASSIWSVYVGNGTTINSTSPQSYETDNTSDKSYSWGAFAKFRLNTNWMMRINVIMSHYSISSNAYNYNYDNPTYTSTFNEMQSYSRNDWQFSIGVEREINIKHFNLFVGANVPVTIYGTANYGESNINDTNGVFYNYSGTTIVYHNGFSAGLGIYGGINYRYKFILIGPQFSLAYLYYSVGGNSQETNVYYGPGYYSTSSSMYLGHYFSKWLVSQPMWSVNLSFDLF
jgi:hypothetical protein